MASQFKIPKKKHLPGSDSPPLHMQSPLSRLQGPVDQLKESYKDQSRGGGADMMHPGRTERVPCKPLFRNVVKTLLGLNSPENGESTANRRATKTRGGQSQQAESSTASFSRWRPKRGSDRLLQPDATSESPPQKKSELCGNETISVKSLDSLAELRGEEHAGRPSSFAQKRRDTVEAKGDGGNSGSEDEFQSSSRASTSVSLATDRRRSLGRDLQDVRERQREKWRMFSNRTAANLKPRLRDAKPTTAEPIILSSEEEDDEDGGRNKMTEQKVQDPQQASSSKAKIDKCKLPLPSFLQLEFTSLHAGLTHAKAGGEMMITEQGVTIPLRAGSEEFEVTVVASQVRGYGVWDGGVAGGGALLAGWTVPAPSLLFLWVSDAQANILHREMTAIHSNAKLSGPACCFLLLVLKEQLQELDAALLASILDMEEYRRGRSSSGGPTSPLDWADGLLLLHSCPPPLDQHLLSLLGHSADESSVVRTGQKQKSSQLISGLQQLPSRLIQYPAAPGKGRITVSMEDLACLKEGQFLNDVIIDFYLKFLLLEGEGGSVAEQSHVFSSFFYKQLTRRRSAGDHAVAVPDRHMRHQRVKTWTRHVDIFTKDFLFVPVNQEAHWYLVVVCFPGLEEIKYEEFPKSTDGSEQSAGKPSISLRSRLDCTRRGFNRDTAVKRPCILVMDSLKLSYHENVCRLVRDYLQVEWAVRRGTPRLFTSDNMRSSNCRVPQQDNSSDCGVYLLQYVESFLENPVVHFDLPLRLEDWFPRQKVRKKREEIRSLILKMHQSQNQET